MYSRTPNGSLDTHIATCDSVICHMAVMTYDISQHNICQYGCIWKHRDLRKTANCFKLLL